MFLEIPCQKEGMRRFPLLIRPSLRARRLILKLTPDGTRAIVTVPKGVDQHSAFSFAQKHVAWVAHHIEKRKRNCFAIEPGHIFLRGVLHRVQSTGKIRGHILISPDIPPIISVPGDALHLKRRLIAFLKQEVLGDLTQRSLFYGNLLGVSFAKILVKDMSTRFGTCSSEKVLTYCWRLILAPPFVLDYVVAHEVCHLVHMNHSLEFWALVRCVCPEFKAAKAWLKTLGHSLYMQGV